MKKLVFSLLVTAICSNITAQDENNFKEVQYNPETGKFSYVRELLCDRFSGAAKSIRKELKWNREAENDFHIQTPYIETPWFNIKKVDVNVSQIAHIIGIYLSIKSAKAEIKSANVPNCVGLPVPTADINRYNVSAFLFCTYRFIAGQQKWPFKIVNQEEATA